MTIARYRFKALTYGLMLGLVSLGQGCGPDDSQDAPAQLDVAQFDKNALLASVAYNVMLPAYEDFLLKATALQDAAVAYDTALASGAVDAETTLSHVRSAWIEAMAVWQRLEVYQVGPAAKRASRDESVGAMGLRDEIYSWPLVNACRIDQEIVEGVYGESDFVQRELVNVYGLDAMEYLLFYTGSTNSCPPWATINEEGQWQALSVNEIARRRASFASVCAQDVLARATVLHEDWSMSGDQFAKQFATAGQGDSLFATSDEALGDVADAMFYVEKITKDYKLAKPAGIRHCSDERCPDDVESRYARLSKEHVSDNLQALQLLFSGPIADVDALGFDDYLIVLGEDALAERMQVNLDAAIDSVDAIPGTLYDAANNLDVLDCETGVEPICVAYKALKRFTDDFKTNFMRVLNLKVPAEAAGDND